MNENWYEAYRNEKRRKQKSVPRGVIVFIVLLIGAAVIWLCRDKIQATFEQIDSAISTRYDLQPIEYLSDEEMDAMVADSLRRSITTAPVQKQQAIVPVVAADSNGVRSLHRETQQQVNLLMEKETWYLNAKDIKEIKKSFEDWMDDRRTQKSDKK